MLKKSDFVNNRMEIWVKYIKEIEMVFIFTKIIIIKSKANRKSQKFSACHRSSNWRKTNRRRILGIRYSSKILLWPSLELNTLMNVDKSMIMVNKLLPSSDHHSTLIGSQLSGFSNWISPICKWGWLSTIKMKMNFCGVNLIG